MILRNTVFNLIGLGAPLVVAVFTIPVLIAALGVGGFGMLTLIWAVVSYFGLFDLGLGRTLTMQMVRAESRGETERIGSMITTALSVMALLGVAVGICVALFAKTGVGFLADLPDRQQAIDAVWAMAWALPMITLTSGLRGVLEARNAFGAVNLIRLPMGIFTFLGPMIVVLIEPRLDWIAWALVAGRWVAAGAHLWVVFKVLPENVGRFRFKASEIRPLLSIGGWLTVSNVVSPLMGYADRFIIAGLVSAAAVAYYATPYEIVTKLWLVPGALTAVLFPALAARIEASASSAAGLVRQSTSLIALILLPVCAFLAIFAVEVLTLWLDAEFARNSALLLQVFSLGVLINSTAQIPFTVIQSAGKPKWTAIIHVAEALPFLLLLWWATASFGVTGAVIAWLVRILVDTALMFEGGRRALKLDRATILPARWPLIIGLTLGSGLVAQMEPLAFRLAGFAVVALFSVLLMLQDETVKAQIARLTARR
jgi:O-antigen/teichoic acid export membrane protein